MIGETLSRKWAASFNNDLDGLGFVFITFANMIINPLASKPFEFYNFMSGCEEQCSRNEQLMSFPANFLSLSTHSSTSVAPVTVAMAVIYLFFSQFYSEKRQRGKNVREVKRIT